MVRDELGGRGARPDPVGPWRPLVKDLDFFFLKYDGIILEKFEERKGIILLTF